MDIKKVGQEFGNVGTSANCNINVVCPLGNGWEPERNSVALIVSGGNEICSGALIMNTCNTDIPYLLTANHCLNSNVQNWVFQFQTWSTTCTGNNGWREDIQFNGCTLRANNAATDFALVQLNQTPQSSSGIRYSGWNRNNVGTGATTIIHHPAGDLMKISRDNEAPVFDNFLNAQCWRLGLNLNLGLDRGATEGGTSGAPYYDQSHRIIGQHYGIDDGNLAICNRSRKFGGRFDLSWTGGGTNATRLSNWLDPSNSGATVTNTTNTSILINTSTVNNIQISGNAEFCSSSSVYTISNPNPALLNITWNVITPSGIVNISTSGNTATLTRIGTNSGIVTLSATITGSCINRTITRNIDVGKQRNLNVIENFKDCYSQNLTSLTPPGTALTWSTDYGGLIDGNASPYNTTNNTVTITSTNQNADYVRVSYLAAAGCTYESSVNSNFCPCPSWDIGSSVTWYQSSSPSNGEPISIEISGGVANAQYYRWFVNGTQIAQTDYPILFTYNWICVDPGNVTCRGYSYNANCGGEVESLDFNCGSYSPICYYRTNSNVTLFPNPAKNETTIKINKIDKVNKVNLSKIKQIKIIDKMGLVKKVINNSFAQTQMTLNLSGLTDDVYYIIISDGTYETKIPLIVKK